MLFTFTGDPRSSPRDAVRFKTGDVDAADPMLSDTEIDYLLDEHGGSVNVAAWRACELAAGRYARMADTSMDGGAKVSLSQRAKGLREHAMTLKEQALWFEMTPVPSAGGISDQQSVSDALDEDLTAPRFYRGQFKPRARRDAHDDDYDRRGRERLR